MKKFHAHLLLWGLWALALAVYFFKVAGLGSQKWGNYVFVLLLHVGTFYLTSYLVMGKSKDKAPRLSRLILAILLETTAIFVVVVLVSIAGGEMTVGIQPDVPRTTRVVNYWEVVFILYAGVAFGCFFGVERRLRGREEHAEWAVAQLEVQLKDSEVMKLSSMMIPHFTNNLLGALVSVTRHRPVHTRAALWLITQMVNAYAKLRPDEYIAVGAELEVATMFMDLLEYERGYAPQIEIDVDAEVMDMQILPMLLMLPLENISKYAVLNRVGKRASIRVGSDGGKLVVHAENDMLDRRKAGTPSTGNGLANMEAKLRLLGVVYQFRHGPVNGRYVFHLVLQLR